MEAIELALHTQTRFVMFEGYEIDLLPNINRAYKPKVTTLKRKQLIEAEKKRLEKQLKNL